jgi:hypothetical protein
MRYKQIRRMLARMLSFYFRLFWRIGADAGAAAAIL